MALTTIRLGLVGYGAGGRWFHAPFVTAAEGITVAGVVARSEERVAEVRADLPDVPIYRSLAEMLEAGVDAVTITTPPPTHEELAEEALAAGVHVVVDKPFVPTAARGRRLVDAANAAGRILCVYQNRRWDADIRTLARLIDDNRLGTPSRVVSRMDQDNFASLKPGPGNGLLLDLGTHVIDQMLWVLGPVSRVWARLGWVDLLEGRTDCSFAIELEHQSGAISYVEATKAHHVSGRDLRAYGDKGCFSMTSSDIQEKLVKSGRRPTDDPASWGYEPPELWGTLHTRTGEERVPSEQGRWHDYYTQFASAIRGTSLAPVSADEAVRVLEVIEAARLSADSGAPAPM
jgi:predicted dehydrogenase